MERCRILKLRIVAPALGLALVAPPDVDAAPRRYETRCAFPRLAQGPEIVPEPMEPVRPEDVPWNTRRTDVLPEPPFRGPVPGEEIVAVPIEIGPEEGRHQCAPPALRVRISLEIEWRRR